MNRPLVTTVPWPHFTTLIRINDQWRICFVWKNGDAHDVEIVDYH
jgi:plasmid maintenance system killer protein